MKQIFYLIIIILFTSCVNQSVIDSVHDRIGESEQIQKKLISKVKMTLLDHGAKDYTILGKRDSLIMATKSAKDVVLNSSNSENIIQAIDLWNEMLPKIFETEKSAKINTDLPLEYLRVFALLELNDRTNRVLEEMARAAVPKQARYDFFQLFFEPNNTNLRYGESYRGKIYFGATSEHTPNVIDIVVNGQRVEFDETGAGTFIVTPTSRGKFNVNAVAKGKTGTLTQDLYVENSFELLVE